MTTYVEVNRIKTKSDRIESQLDDALQLHTKLQKKTRNQYLQTAITLLECVKKITQILEMDSLVSIDDMTAEFEAAESTNSSNLADALESTEAEFKNYQNFTGSGSIESNPNKNTLKKYSEVIDKSCSYCYEYRDELECAQMIKLWFDARFRTSSKTFKYNIQYLPRWLSGIIVAYGKHLERGDIYQFKESLFEWCNKVKADPDSVRWAVPYEIQQLCSNKGHPDEYTMQSVLLGDMLMDDVFYELTDSCDNTLSAPMDCYPVASLVKKNNSTLTADIRKRLANKESLLNKYQFTKMGGQLT